LLQLDEEACLELLTIDPRSFSSLIRVTGYSREKDCGVSWSRFGTNGIGSGTLLSRYTLRVTTLTAAGFGPRSICTEIPMGGSKVGVTTGEERGGLGGSVESGGERWRAVEKDDYPEARATVVGVGLFRRS